jgi:hypothetical protein
VVLPGTEQKPLQQQVVLAGVRCSILRKQPILHQEKYEG